MALDSMLTNGFGNYLFTGLSEGLYYVKLNGTGIPANHISATGDGIYDNDGAGAYEPYVGTNNNEDGTDDGTQMGGMIMSDTIRLTLGSEPGGNVNLTVDFGLYEPHSPFASLGNYVWYDVNHNGQQDSGETGVDGVILQLFDLGTDGVKSGDDNLVSLDTTDANGFYLFENLNPGSYYVMLDPATLPAYYNPTIQNVGDDTTDSDADEMGMTQVVVLSPEENDLTVDIGIEPEPASLGDYVWDDTDHDGQQDGGEPGVGDVVVKLFDLGPDGQKGGGDDNLVALDTTDASGFYLFENLDPGSYYVMFDLGSLPSGYYPSLQDATGDDTNDSDANLMGMTDVLVLDAGEMDDDTDFGVYEPLFDLALYKALSPGQPDTVDINDDVRYTIKVVNEGNTAAAQIAILDHIPAGMLLSPNDVHWTSVNNSTASYLYAGPLLPGDTFSIEIILLVQYGASGATMTNVAEVESAEDEGGNVVTDTDSTPDNGDDGEDDQDDQPIELVPHDPTGWVYCDKTGEIINGGTISVTGPNGIPNSQVNIIHDGSNGYYEFYTDGTPGIYTLTYTHPNGYPMSTTCLPQPDTLDPTGLADPLVLGVDTLGGAIADTACTNNPYYLNFDLAPGDPIILHNNLPVQCIFIGSIVCEDVDLNDNYDGTEPGMANVTVNLYDCADTLNPIRTTVTDALGHYQFTGLLPGDYRVQFVSPNNYRYIQNGNVSPNGFAPCVTLAFGDCDTTTSICMIACPLVDAGAGAMICLGDTAQLQATVNYGSGNFSWTPTTGLNNANIANPLANPNATTTYLVSYDDGFGCGAATDSTTVFVSTTDPIITYTPFSDTTIYCTDAVPFDAPQFMDACDTMLIVTLDSIVNLPGCNGSIERTWTATNGGGNSVSFTQTVNFLDTVPPVMFAIHPIFGVLAHGDTLYANCNQIASFDSTGFSAYDECCPTTTITFAETVTPGVCDVDGYIQLMFCGWTATDCCGNTDSLFFTVVVSDNSAPVLAGVPNDTTTTCGNVPAAPAVTATDNCDTAVPVVFGETILPSVGGCDSLVIRTWTATDSCGNIVSDSQTINVFDTVPPTMTANHAFFGNINHGDTLYADCSQIPSLDSIGFAAFDNCCATTVTFDETKIRGNCAVDGYVELRYCGWTATDCCGNTDSLFFTVIIDDNTPPVITGVPADITTTCNNIPPVPGVSATDACFPTVNLSFNQNTIQAFSGCDSLIVRTWTATDSCGNIATASQNIRVLDTIPPTLSVSHPFFGNVSDGDTLYADCSQVGILNNFNLSTSDNCCGVTSNYFENAVQGNCPTDGYLERRTIGWTASDCCGNTDSLFFTVFVSDTQQPLLSGVPGSGTVDCSAIPLPATVTATDDCDGQPMLSFNETSSFDTSTGGCYILTRTWTAVDHCGNTAVGTQQLTVIDNVAPILASAPADTSVACIADIPPAAVLSVSDNCDATIPVNLVETSTGNPAGCNFVLTRTWTATDDCGNSDVEVQVITVNDTVPPVLSPAPPSTTVSCSLPVPAPATLTATDNCDANVQITVSDSYIGDPSTGCYLITRTWTAVDDCGNFDTDSQQIMVVDFTPPVLQNVPANTTATCENLPIPNVTATDNCDPDVPVTMTETYTTLPNGCITQILRTFTATDDCNNTAFATQTIFIINGAAPVITLNNPLLAGLGDGDTLFMECNGLVSLSANMASATSDCCPNTTIQFFESVIAAGSCATDGYMQVMRCGWVASDCCGNVDSLFLTVVVSDFTPPVFYGIPADLTVMCGQLVPPPANVVAVDNCDNHVDIVYNQTTATIPAGSQITRTWVGTDNCGNFTTRTQIITVLNDNPPVMANLPADLTLTYPAAVPPPANVTVTDDCDANPQMAFSETTNGNGCCFTMTRQWTATDYYGNSVSHTQVITMLDNQPPVLSGIPANQTYDCSVVNVPLPNVTATDNCATNPTLTMTSTTTQLSCGYQITRTWTATDQCNNSSTGSTTMTFLDTTKPVLVGVPADITLSCNQPIPAPANVTATDNCDNSPGVAFNQSQSGTGCIYTITRTWTALDDCGNSASASQTITVNNDLVLPQLIGLPSDITVDCGNVPPVATVTATDNCDLNVDLSFVETISNNCPFKITRTWVATDDCGNSISGSQVITLIDNLAPSISNVPGNMTVQCDEVPPVPSNVTVADNCDGNPSLTFAESSVGTLCHYTLTRTWTAQDNCGNVLVATQLITVIDTEAPIVTNVPPNDTLECIDDIPITPFITATDNCDDNVTVVLQEDYDVNDCLYTLTRTWTATDNCGNSTTAQQVIVYDDTTPPVFDFLPADTTFKCDSIITPPFVTATDNCDTFVEVFFQESVIGSGCTYEIQRTWTAMDDCLNETVYTQTITVVDDEAPVFEEPADITVGCGEVPAAVMPLVTENCDTALIFDFVETTVPLACGREIHRTWTATDHCNNVATVNQVITVTDTIVPQIVFTHPLLVGMSSGDTVDMQCEFAINFTVADAAATDNCGIASFVKQTGSTHLGNCMSDGYIFLVNDIWRATDSCGNQTVVNIYRRLIDTIPPVFLTVPADVTVACGDPVPAFGTPTADDACLNVTLVSHTDSLPRADGYDLVRTWTAIDGCGNSAVASQTIAVNLNGVPSLVGVPADTIIYVASGGQVPAVPSVTGVEGCTGNSLAVSFNQSATPSANGCDTTLVRTWSATDNFGKTVADTQSILLVKKILVDIATTPETCAGSDGTAALAPDTLDFAWNDGGTGAVRNDLGNGIYTVLVTDGGCTDTIQVNVDLDCVCDSAQIEIVALAASCLGNDGTAFLTPDTLNYAWSDGGTGNFRSDLAPGVYTVVASYCLFTDTVQVIIDSECDCVPAVADSIAITGATCGESDGSAIIFLQGNAADYSYTWLPDVGTPGLTGNARTGLPTGHYQVAMQYQSNPDCVDTIEFDLTDDCFNCPDLSNVDALVSQDDGTAMVCVPVPFGAMPGLDIQVNGINYTSGLQGCDNQSVIAYDYSTAYDGAQSGKFEVQWQHNGLLFQTLVNNMDELAAGMSQVDAAGHWKNDKKSYRLITTNLAGSYGQLTLTHLSSAVTTQHGPYQSNAFMGTEMLLAVGENNIVLANPATACTSELLVTLEPEPAPIFAQDMEALSGDCMVANQGLCLDIPVDEQASYQFMLDGQPFDNFTDCGAINAHSYSYQSLPPSGPYQLGEWTVNGQTFSAVFNAVGDLVNLMNLWDPQGNWTNSGSAIVGGKTGSVYGKMVIHQAASTFVINAENVMLGGNLYLELVPGEHLILATRLSDGFSDSLTVMVACITTDQYQYTINTGESGTLCFDLSELLGNQISIENSCDEGLGGAAVFIINEADACVDFTGAQPGVSEACFTLCDEFGICDTVLLTVHVELINAVGEAARDSLVVYNAFSPNGDGYNDYFKIDGLQRYPGSELSIYSRYGQKVFSSKDYKNDWGGSWGSNNLPNGTYFYILELGGEKRLTGYLQVER
ncbi:MAG: SdrD B-like domain-containing protein [Saprospiraceae bacterium]